MKSSWKRLHPLFVFIFPLNQIFAVVCVSSRFVFLYFNEKKKEWYISYFLGWVCIHVHGHVLLLCVNFFLFFLFFSGLMFSIVYFVWTVILDLWIIKTKLTVIFYIFKNYFIIIFLIFNKLSWSQWTPSF